MMPSLSPLQINSYKTTHQGSTKLSDLLRQKYGMTNIDWTTWHATSKSDARLVLKSIQNREPLPMQSSERKLNT